MSAVLPFPCCAELECFCFVVLKLLGPSVLLFDGCRMDAFFTETSRGLAISTQHLQHPFLLSRRDGAGQTVVMPVCDWSLPAGASAPHARSVLGIGDTHICVVVSRQSQAGRSNQPCTSDLGLSRPPDPLYPSLSLIFLHLTFVSCSLLSKVRRPQLSPTGSLSSVWVSPQHDFLGQLLCFPFYDKGQRL